MIPSQERNGVTYGEMLRWYSFGRFLKDKWWFSLLILAKIFRPGNAIDNKTFAILVGIAVVVLGGWYLIVVGEKVDEARKQYERLGAISQAPQGSSQASPKEEQDSSPGKRRVSDTKATGEFASLMFKVAGERWPLLVNDLKEFLGEDGAGLDEKRGQFEFALALLTCQMGALVNLYPLPVASRLRAKTIAWLLTTRVGAECQRLVEGFERAWFDSLEAGELPTKGVAKVLLTILCDGRPVQAGDFGVVMLLSAELGLASSGYWKELSENAELIPE